ncbi:diaminopimelate decarboxylase [Coriobacteriia bacterium Es71-Z0120]|uniref:diaminopimelate decarboxylase n=1 Tax=Parvivirga hydrogeniphila TaxID=2939460 RepID=UPI002260949D|nr:diaminopimelate decarboxylase [Parvivirga hydrogeniphila]MCL4079282.1 diaminopimelate decarboxylase [Parvivirga hydrogeniphila]
MSARPSAPRPPAEPDQRTAADLAAVLPMTAEVRDGHLWIGGVDTVALAREAGTALYVMDEATIRHQLREYVRWTRYHWPDVDVVYAGKAFLTLAMVRIIEEEDCCLLCASGGELAYALRAGFPVERVQVHGNNKTPQELAECLDARVGRIVVDNFVELERISAMAVERGLTQKVLIRVTPGIAADTHDFIMTGAEDSKFGFGLNQGLAMEAVERALALPGVDFDGLHMHIGSQIFALKSFAKAIEVMVAFMREIRDRTGAVVQMLDVGGGLGVKYGVPDEPSSIKDFGKVVVDGIKEECEKHGLAVPRMAVEPGRSIVANAGVTLYTVGAIKEIPGIRTYVAVDGGMSDNIRTSLYDAHYEALVANKADRPRSVVVTIAGKHCESGDVVVRDAPLQEPEVGDVVCVCATGAYCYSMSSNYNKQVRPGIVFVRDGSWRWSVRRETYDDLMATDLG